MHEEPPRVLSYASRQPTPAVAFVREGNEVTITIPPPPLWRVALVPGMICGIWTVTATALTLYALQSLSRGGAVRPLVLLLNLLGAVACYFWFAALWRLVRVVRHGGRPSVLSVAEGLLTVLAPLQFGKYAESWDADDIADLTVFGGGATPLLLVLLHLRMTLKDESVVIISLPWPHAEAMAPVETHLRVALGLPVAVSRAGA